jgi:hypothetical protein
MLAMFMLFSACAVESPEDLQARLAEEQPIIPPRPETADPSARAYAAENLPDPPPAIGGEITDIDLDLTQLGVTMVSAQVTLMMMFPEDFLGQSVRVRGSYLTIYWGLGEMYLHYVVLDLTAGCCGQAIEFKLTEELAESVGYPQNDSVIEVTGVFSYYEKMGHVFFYLLVSDIQVE